MVSGASPALRPRAISTRPMTRRDGQVRKVAADAGLLVKALQRNAVGQRVGVVAAAARAAKIADHLHPALSPEATHQMGPRQRPATRSSPRGSGRSAGTAAPRWAASAVHAGRRRRLPIGQAAVEDAGPLAQGHTAQALRNLDAPAAVAKGVDVPGGLQWQVASEVLGPLQIACAAGVHTQQADHGGGRAEGQLHVARCAATSPAGPADHALPKSAISMAAKPWVSPSRQSMAASGHVFFHLAGPAPDRDVGAVAYALLDLPLDARNLHHGSRGRRA